MTYQQKFEKLRNTFAQKSDRYIRAEKELSSIMGWGDSAELNEFLNAKKEFAEAENNYHNFLSHVRTNNILPDEEFSSK